MEGPVVLFDGVCNLCSASVDFILARDPGARYRFAALQSPAGRRLLEDHGLSEDLATIVLIEGGRAYVRSDAALRIARGLTGPARLLGLFLWVPRPLRDLAYRLVARYRYAWFGVREACRAPSPGDEDRFLP